MAEGREFEKNLRSLNRTINLISERSIQFLQQNAFLTFSWRFLKYITSEQLELKLENIFGI